MPKPNQYGVTKVGERWRARPYVPGRGKHLYAGTYDSREEAVRASLKKIEDERRLPPHRETIASFCARWVKDFPRPKQSTNDRYHADATRFAGEYGDKRLDEISVPTARSWSQAHPHDHAALRAMYGDAKRDGLVLSNPFSELRISKGRGRQDIAPLTIEEVDKLGDIALAADKDFGPTFRSVILWAAFTTMRPGEIFGLDREDVDLEAGTVRIERQLHKRRIQLPKSNKKRSLPYLPPQAADALRDLPRRVHPPRCPITGGQILFPGKLEQRITASALTGYWKPVKTAFLATLSEERRRELQNVKGATDFYALRHAGATYMVERGVESWIVARMMGHEDGGRLVEQRYGHPRDSIARERLRQAFSEPTSLQVVRDQRRAANG